jgi:hypothetical protein
VKSVWNTLAPGVRACYRNGAIHIECFGVKEGISQCTIEPVYVDAEYLPEGIVDTHLLSRDQFFTSALGVTVAISYYSSLSQADKERLSENALTNDEICFLTNFNKSNASSEELARAKLIHAKAKVQHNKAQKKPDIHALNLLKPKDYDLEAILAESRGEALPNAKQAVESLAKQLNGETITPISTELIKHQ